MCSRGPKMGSVKSNSFEVGRSDGSDHLPVLVNVVI